MGFRFLAFIVGIALIYLVLKSYFRNLQQQSRPPQTPPIAENMVRCVVCGVNTPRSEAIFSGGEFFCCDEHRQARRK